jgi:hypothetical protein
MTPGSSADATVRGSAARAQSGRALCRPCNRPMPSRRETKAVVHGGAPQRSLLGESACSPNLLGRQPRASDGITVHRHAREQHGGGVPVRDSRFPRQSAHLAATGSDAVEIRPEQESDQARSGLPLGRLAPLAGGWNPAGRASISAPRPPHRFVWRSGVLDAATPRSAGVQRGVTSRTAASGGSSSRLMSRLRECYCVHSGSGRPTLGRSADLGDLVMSPGATGRRRVRVPPDRLRRLASTRLTLAAVARR